LVYDRLTENKKVAWPAVKNDWWFHSTFEQYTVGGGKSLGEAGKGTFS
jgi:hypothetical protein